MSEFQKKQGGRSSLKDSVLKLLQNSKGQSLSGSDMANELHVSRNTIWRAVGQLKEEGYQIEAVTNVGYCLKSDNNILSVHGIRRYLQVELPEIEVYKSVSSTNTVLKEKAEKNAPHGTVVIAEEQTGGRGRMGRPFFSPSRTGLYMSILLRPDLPFSESLRITTCAAVAVAEAIEKQTDRDCRIKWVNDIFCEDKKVSGILTEASFDMENQGIQYAVLGIGVNVFPPHEDFPKELEGIAVSLLTQEERHEDFRNRLAAEILNTFMKYYENIMDEKLIQEYRARSFLLGKEINIVTRDGSKRAAALDIDSQFRLKVRMEDGEVRYLSSGEVSVRSR